MTHPFGRTLVVAPHPDDEVLGAGGTIARLADEGQEVWVCVVTTGAPPLFDAAFVQQIRAEAAEAHAILGVHETRYLDQPAAGLSETPHAVLNAAIGALVREVEPQTLLVPFVGDIHMDHQLIALSSLVAARPHAGAFPVRVLAYETLSETNWNAPYLAPGFTPNTFVDIADTLPRKLDAMRCYRSQLRPAPDERSLEALSALATLRGATVHRHAAEGFVHLRGIV